MLEYNDILLRHSKSIVASRSECDTSMMLGNHEFAVPIVAANMQSIITPNICRRFDKADWFYVYHRIKGTNDVFEFVDYAHDAEMNIVSISVGVKEEWLKLVRTLYKQGYIIDYFTVDVALSYNENVTPILDTIRECYPDAYIILGNGATAEWARWVIDRRLADCIKVGIGVSTSCRTRQYTGYGSSTVSSLLEVVKETNGEIDIISDGGLTVNSELVGFEKVKDKKTKKKQHVAIYKKEVAVGDVAKAIVIGANMVMSGALFAYCTDVPAAKEGYYGNASARAKGHNTHVEGETLHQHILRSKTVEEMMELAQYSLRSSISYSGNRNLEELRQNGKYDIKFAEGGLTRTSV